MSDEIEDEKLIDCKIIFDLFDKDKDGTITTSDLDDSIRASGLNPTQNELDQIKSQLDKENDGRITFSKFLDIYLTCQQNAPTEETLLECFKAFDKKNEGRINFEEFKKAMTTVGDCMDEASFDEIMEKVEHKDGYINYGEVVKELLSK